MSHIIKKPVEEWLYAVEYEEDIMYMPSDFALKFVTFIKLVNGGTGEENKTPVIHYKMLDNVGGKKQNIANLCARGMAKTTIMGEYMILYIATYGGIDGFGDIPLGLYVSDSIENGVKNMRKNLEYRWANSDFLQQYIPETRFTDVRWEFKNVDGNTTIFKGYGAKALSLDSTLHTEYGTTTIADCQVGDKIFGADGKLATITKKSEIFHRPMYEILLEDGRHIKVSDEHINSVVHKENINNKATYTKKDLYTSELLELPLVHTRTRIRKDKPNYTSKENLLFIENCKPIEKTYKMLYEINPYLLGLLLGDGSSKQDGSNVLTAHKDDMKEYLETLSVRKPEPGYSYQIGNIYQDKRNINVETVAIKGISGRMRQYKLQGVHGDHKFIPKIYLDGSIEQRLELLQGLMDTDGSIQKNGRMDFCSNSEQLVDDVSSLVRSLGGTAKKRKVKKAFRIEIWIEFLPFKLKRKAIRFKPKTKNLVAIKNITRIKDEPSQCIAIDNEEHQFITGDYFRTHNTGVRGAKEMGQRPYIAILDDLISDEDARSETVRASIEDTVYKAVDYALHPSRRKIIWSGTPFNANDPLYKAVESGGWYVNVYPVCEKFPCTREEFRGGWEDRFTYDFVKSQYDKSVATGKIAAFNQELMLRIMSDEDRLIREEDLVFFDRSRVLMNKDKYNFYITTDFATSEKKSADYSVISVWAYNNAGDWLWVDGTCRRQNMSDNINDLFRFAQIYKPQSVGIEVTGQQGGFINWIQDEMLSRNIYFNLASEGSNPGLRPKTNKMERFNVVVPLFKMRKVWFPKGMEDNESMIEAMDELRNASAAGFKSKHDDFIDTVSMLAQMNPWKPSEEATYELKDGAWFEFEEEEDTNNSLIF